MIGDLLRGLQRAVVLEVRGDAGRAEGVIRCGSRCRRPRRGAESSGRRPAATWGCGSARRSCSLEINVLPGDGGDLFGALRTLGISGRFLVLQEPREDRGVVKDDTVGDQAAAFRPEFLFILGFETELAEAGMGDGAA